MPNRVLIIDTSVLCCLLQIPGKETSGSGDDRWNHEKVAELIGREEKNGSILVLPLATLIETGNHIAQAQTDRFKCAESLAELIRKAANATTPWAAFTEQVALWEVESLLQLAEEWPRLAASKLSIGDATIRRVAEYYARAAVSVEIVTGDAGLKAYEPSAPTTIPRRRR